QRRRFKIEDTLVDADDSVDDRELEIKSGLAHHADRFAEPHDERLMGLINRENRGVGDDDREDSQGKRSTPLHWLPPVCGGRRVNSLRGSTGTTPLLVLSLPGSRMILSVPPNRRSMVSRYMRLRVTSGAFLYSS